MTTTILNQAPAAILSNYADVIEGGNAYRGSGDDYAGIPTLQSKDRAIDEIGTLTPTLGGNTTTLYAPTSLTAAQVATYVRTDIPPVFILCTSNGEAEDRNVGAARKVTGWTAGGAEDDIITFGEKAWPVSTNGSDTYVARIGYKRVPDIYDIEADGPERGWDRTFQLRLFPGNQLDLNGNGTRWFAAELEVRLRFEKHRRERLALDSLLENLTILRSVIPQGDNRDATFVQSIDARTTEPEIVEDSDKVVITDRYDMTYRVQSKFL